MGLKVFSDAVPHLLGVAGHRQHRQDGLNQHPVVPLAPVADFQVGRVSLGGVETRVREQHRAAVEHVEQGADPSVMGIGGSPDPADDLPEVVNHLAPLGPHDPAVVGDPGVAELLGAVPPAHRVDQLDAVAVHDAQQPKRDKFAGLERRLGMLGDVQRPVVYSAEQADDKVFVGHGEDSDGKSVFGQTPATVVPVHGLPK